MKINFLGIAVEEGARVNISWDQISAGGRRMTD